jgi:hypothetical protein
MLPPHVTLPADRAWSTFNSAFHLIERPPRRLLELGNAALSDDVTRSDDRHALSAGGSFSDSDTTSGLQGGATR